MNTQPKRPTAEELGPMRPMEAFQQDAATELQQAANPVKPNKAELQRFIQSNYRVEFNELTRDCELDGSPMGSLLHLADSFLAQQHGIEVTKQSASDSFEFVARSNPYNPVRRYLLGLRDRIDLKLISMDSLGKAFGIQPADTVSHRLLASHLAGTVNRGLEPGCKHDQLLVLAGLQGTGKSSAIEALAGSGWYDSATRIADLEGKDTLAKINSAWLFEIDECEHTLQKILLQSSKVLSPAGMTITSRSTKNRQRATRAGQPYSELQITPSSSTTTPATVASGSSPLKTAF